MMPDIHSNSTEDKHIVCEHDITTLVDKAKEIFLRLRKRLWADSSFQKLLQAYSNEIDKSMNLMMDLGIPDLCARCATSLPGGGCCSAQIASWYDPVLLSINLFLGTELQTSGYYEGCCIFLGRDGCTLKARYHFCVNYLCTTIREKVLPKRLAQLEAQYGRELFLGWQLELLLRQNIANIEP